MKIYTKTGDKGQTSLFSGERVPKTHARVECYGTVDELNAVVGVARAHNEIDELEEALAALQGELFNLASRLATVGEDKAEGVIDRTNIERLEKGIDGMAAQLPPLKNFIFPTGTATAAHLHQARTVCRRAERRLLSMTDQGGQVNEADCVYLNRLSDYLFTLARFANFKAGRSDATWSRGK